MYKASHTLLSTVAEQRFVYRLDMLDYKRSMNLRNKPSWCENNKKKNKRPFQQDQEKELAKRFGLPCPSPDTVR